MNIFLKGKNMQAYIIGILRKPMNKEMKNIQNN